jgi:hypothetical protein
MKLVVIESPFSGDFWRNTAYARECMRDSLARGEAPFASHLLYTQDGILSDSVPEDREYGIRAGLAWARHADLTAVYTDLGISEGMAAGIQDAERVCRPVEFRRILAQRAG